ncbi:MAG TPA: CpsD/CapB family tyrosine-protein kinase [Bacteroidota bacterium]|nr:CpsD/CapB family tyrosine-protein kinase [Bacteroidota bacterium]
MKPPDETPVPAGEQLVHESNAHRLTRIPKSIIVSESTPQNIDNKIVAFDYYNCFNYSLLAGDHENINLTVGITSPNPGEGKTLVASNLAVSLALGYERETVIVDLNVSKPRLHEVFGTPLVPGLLESMQNGSVHLSRTSINHLSILSAGSATGKGNGDRRSQSTLFHRAHREPAIGLKQLAAFRDVIHSLEQKYEFVIVDMPALHTRGFPILYANELNGLLLVIDTRKTKRQDVEKVFRQLHERQVLGFVFNRFVDEDS